jgi:ankyrin repeat protein
MLIGEDSHRFSLNENLYYAVMHNDFSTTQLLLKWGANANYTGNIEIPLLCQAALLSGSDNGALFQLLLDYGAAPDFLDFGGRSALHYAAVSGNEKVVNILLKNTHILDINRLDACNGTPLYYAAKEGHNVVVNQLLKKGADVNLRVSRYSIRRLGQWLDKLEIVEDTPLIAAIKNNYPRIAKSLIQAGADVNLQGVYNNTALHHAVSLQSIDMIAALIKAGAEVSIKNNDHKTPKDIAILKNKTKVLCYLTHNIQTRYNWTTHQLKEVSKLFILLKGEHRLILFMLSQIGRASKRTSMHLGGALSALSLIKSLTIIQKESKEKPIHLPTEIWQRIGAFWMQDILCLDQPTEEINSKVGLLFEHIDDILKPVHHMI